MRKLFLDPSTDDIEALLQQIQQLHDVISRSVVATSPRIKGVTSKGYSGSLNQAELPMKPQPTEQILADIAEMFKGAVRWHYPGTLININPPPLITSVAVMTLASLYNPNLAMDVPCGWLALAELEVVKHVSQLAGWNWRTAGGLFTFGGKGTNLYAVRVAVQRCWPSISAEGIRDRMVVFSNVQGHPCHIEVCEWLGLGRENCIRLPVARNGLLDWARAVPIMRSYFDSGVKVPCIIVNGGTTLHNSIDQIACMVEFRDQLVEEYGLPYRPHVHVDSVIGWAWLFFRHYDFGANPLGIDPSSLEKLRRDSQAIAQVSVADSFGVDFHKTGFCPYTSSLFMARDRSLLEGLGSAQQPTAEELEFGNYAPFTYSLESSRAATSALVALVALKSLGIEGFQRLIGGLVGSGEQTRRSLSSTPGFCTVNLDASGFATLFLVLPCQRLCTFQEFLATDQEEAFRIAKYNYEFYLYLLEAQALHDYPLAIDYVSGYDTTQSGTRFGVLKIFPMSPAYDSDFVERVVTLLSEALREFDGIGGTYHPKAVPHRPKPFVTR
jgi:L-2,4-diaminobutyrate decarboxylase